MVSTGTWCKERYCRRTHALCRRLLTRQKQADEGPWGLRRRSGARDQGAPAARALNPLLPHAAALVP